MKIGFKDAKAGPLTTRKLKLKSGEKARIVLLEESPSYIYAHVIRDPSDPDKARYFKCLGDEDMIESIGRDSDNCPACVVAQGNKEAAVRLAQPRYAVNVATYQLRNDNKPVEPPVLEVIPWIFARGKIKLLQDLMEEYGNITLEKDIVLKCDNEKFQEFDMMVNEPAWKKTKEGQAQLKAALVSTKNGGPLQTDEELCDQICTSLTVDQYRRMLEVAPALSDDEVEEEVQKTLADLRGDGLTDSALASVDDDDDDPSESDETADFAEIIARGRPKTRAK